jgi:putative nucleotidyltransferase with HDIG domain
MPRVSKKLRIAAPEQMLFAWVGFLAASAIATLAALVFAGFRIQSPVTVVVLVVVAIVVERATVPFPGGEVSAGSLVFVFAAVALGPVPAALVAASGLIVDLPRRDTERPILRWVTWTSLRVLEGVAASFAAIGVKHFVGSGLLATFAMVFAAFAAETATWLSLGPVAAAIRRVNTFRGVAATFAPPLIGSVPLYAPMVAILIYSYETVSPWSVALFMVPAIAAQRLHLLYRKQRDTAQALVDANERLSSANLSFATALVATLDARDQYTAGHSAAVAIYARDIAIRMGLSDRDQELVHLCGLVHDIGKIGLPAGLLEKPGSLSLDERRQMERHSEIGESILRNVDDYAEIAAIVRHHHERVDGNGYPDRLVGDEIPVLARIIAVADAYNAMTSDRPYRDAMPSRVARLRLAQAVESQFDTAVVAAFEAILTAGSEEYRMAAGRAFVLVHEPWISNSEVEAPVGLYEELEAAATHVAFAFQ